MSSIGDYEGVGTLHELVQTLVHFPLLTLTKMNLLGLSFIGTTS
jgi:hypothetical protein